MYKWSQQHVIDTQIGVDSHSGSVLVSINEVNLRWARLLLGWVTMPCNFLQHNLTSSQVTGNFLVQKNTKIAAKVKCQNTSLVDHNTHSRQVKLQQFLISSSAQKAGTQTHRHTKRHIDRHTHTQTGT